MREAFKMDFTIVCGASECARGHQRRLVRFCPPSGKGHHPFLLIIQFAAMRHEEKILNSYHEVIQIMKFFIYNWLRIQDSRSNFSILAVAVRLKVKNCKH